jgi:hypothetical protein
MYFIIVISYVLVLLLTPAAVILSRWTGSRLALPLLTAIAGYFPFLLRIQVSLLDGFLILLWWTVILSILVLWFSRRQPELMRSLIWRSQEYSDSMFRWIETQQLPEGSTRQVLFFHFKQTLIYCALAFLSANFFALILGSALLNYMNFYVASLARASAKPRKALWMGWNPWSIIRVVSFLYLGIVVSTPMLWLLIPIPWKLRLALFAPGLAGIALDLVLKITLSKSWSLRLRKL